MSDAPRLPAPVPAVFDGLLADVPLGTLDETFRAACARLDLYIDALIGGLAESLALHPGDHPGIAELVRRRGWSEQGELPVRWLFETLELYGRAERAAEGWRITRRYSGPTTTQLRAEALALLPSAAPAYDVIELSAKALPSVLEGKSKGEDALFTPGTLGLWFDYFSNDNPLYAPNNSLVAIAADRALRAGASILEVGGGGGSAAQAVITSLTRAAKPPARYVFTELQPAFLRRGARAVQSVLPPDCELRTAQFDINRDPRELPALNGEFDAVIAVNTVHLAQELVATLGRLRSLLRPGGALILGELARPAATGAVHLELPFTLLEAYRRAPLDPHFRPRPGFLTSDGWMGALDAAGFSSVTLLPQHLDRCVELYPGFYCAAFTAIA